MALDIWYQQPTPDNTHPEGATVTVKTVAELDAFVDQVLADSKDFAVPPMIQAAVSGDFNAPVLDVGLGAERGFIQCLSRDGGWSLGDASLAGFVEYDYMAHLREIPASAEVPVALVRAGLREFLETGTKPAALGWNDGCGTS